MNYEEYCEKRDALGLTDHAIANYSKISKSTFSQWKNGKLKPSERTMNKLKFFFDNYDPDHYYESAVDYYCEIDKNTTLTIEPASKRSKMIYVDSFTIQLNNGMPLAIPEDKFIELKKYAAIFTEAWLRSNNLLGVNK